MRAAAGYPRLESIQSMRVKTPPASQKSKLLTIPYRHGTESGRRRRSFRSPKTTRLFMVPM